MALIKSKQVQSLVASKVTTTADQQFTSDVEKTAFADKYTKVEIDNKTTDLANQHETDIVAVNASLATNVTALTNTISSNNTTLQNEVDTINTTLTNQINTSSASLSSQLNTMNTNLQAQISSQVAGITWKVPVANLAAIATTYPVPQEGWMVTVGDTNKVYRYDSETASWVDFPLQLPTTYSRTIDLIPTAAQTVINTGIRNDGTGIYKTAHAEIVLTVNGFVQQPGAGKDYTTSFQGSELIITWSNRLFTLDSDDELTITYTHFDIV